MGTTLNPLPSDRRADAYAMYSSLLPFGQTATSKASSFPVSDTTIDVLMPRAPCWVPHATNALAWAQGGTNNPHNAVTPPDADRRDYEEVLTDFDMHCHDRYRLEAGAWKTTAPVLLLDQAQQNSFLGSRYSGSTGELFKGAVALYAFSAPFFNAHHTVALVYASQACGGLCGEGYWVAFRKTDGVWKALHWSSAYKMS